MSVHATGLLNVAAAALPWGRYEETRGLLRAAAALIPDAEHHRVAEGSRLIEATLAWHTGAWDGLAPAMRRLRRTRRRPRCTTRWWPGSSAAWSAGRARRARRTRRNCGRWPGS